MNHLVLLGKPTSGSLIFVQQNWQDNRTMTFVIKQADKKYRYHINPTTVLGICEQICS